MKIGIVGIGMVGATAAYTLVMRGIGSEIVLINRNAQRAQAEAEDISHAVPFVHPIKVYAGDYSQLAGSRVVIVAAGIGPKPGDIRSQHLERNIAMFRDMIPAILANAPDAVLVITTNPLDIMTHLAARLATQYGVASSRVVGSGTTLDTARFRVLLGAHLGIDPQHVHGYVVGEHGDSEVLTWSSVTVGGIPLKEFCARRHIALDAEVRSRIDQDVRRAAYSIIASKGATYYGIGSALARIVDAILNDQRSILTVCTPVDEVVGVKGVTVALPHLVGGSGVLATLPLPLNAEEQTLLHKSASIVKEAIDTLPVG